LLGQDEIEGEIAERLPSGRGVTWIEVTEIYLAVKGADTAVGWAYEQALDAVAKHAQDWLRKKKRNGRPQSVVIKSLGNEPERKIDMDKDGKVTESRWVTTESPDEDADADKDA